MHNSMNWYTSRHIAWVGLLILGGVAGCERHDASSPAEASRKVVGDGLNVLLLSVDTTRADHLGCYGNPIVKTPNIDRFAAEGARFANCISSAPVTLPSHSTMLTGSYQFVHGARDNGVYKLPTENATLAELFKNAGYATLAQVSAVVLDSRYGLNQGFDLYEDVSGVRNEQGRRSKSDPLHVERKADEVTPRAIELLRQNVNRPFFMFLHYFDPHKDYTAPERFASQYADGYLAEIAFFDEQFGLLMSAIDELGLTTRTLVLLVSDHGEGLGQHGEATHSYFLYDTTQHVPLIMRCPGHVPAGQVVKSQVRLVDLAPTIVDFAQLELTEQMQGTSLLPLLVEPDMDLELPCYADTMTPHIVFGFSMLRSLRDGEWKYIHGPKAELYNLAEDPKELFNLATAEPDIVADMREQLREIIAQSPPPPGGRQAAREMDSEQLSKLEALGYLGAAVQTPSGNTADGQSELDAFEPQGPHPRDRLETIALMCNAVGAVRGRKFPEAEQLYSRLLEQEPDNGRLLRGLGDSLAGQGRLEEAIDVYRKSLKAVPDDSMTQRSLAKCLELRGDSTLAEREYRRMIELNPTQHTGYLGLANMLSEQGRFEEALVEYAAADALLPDSAVVSLKWGMACKLSGETEEAAERLKRACELNPTDAAAHVYLADTFDELNRRSEAIDAMNVAVRLRPDDSTLRRKLVKWLMREGRYAEATEHSAREAQLHEEVPQALFNYGLNLAKVGRHKEAIEQFRQAVEKKPDYVRAQLELVNSLEATDRISEAVTILRKLAALHVDAGRIDDAIAVIDRASRLAKSNGDDQQAAELLSQRQAYEQLRSNGQAEESTPRQ